MLENVWLVVPASSGSFLVARGGRYVWKNNDMPEPTSYNRLWRVHNGRVEVDTSWASEPWNGNFNENPATDGYKLAQAILMELALEKALDENSEST